MKQVFLDNLPKTPNGIDWKNTVGYKIEFIYENISGFLEIINYIPNKQRLIVKYLDNSEYNINTSALLQCKLGNLLSIYSKKHKYNIGKILKDEKRNIRIIKQTRIKNGKWKQKSYNYKCLLCGAEIKNVLETSLTNGSGCPCCRGLIVIKGINDLATTHPQLVKYFANTKDVYKITYGSDKKSDLKCPDCGYEKKMTVYNLNNQGFGCPRCGDGISYPNKFMFNLLEQLNIDFKLEYSPHWIAPKRYDFYFKLDDGEYIVEMDGLQHKVGWNKNAKEQIHNDLEKDCKAKENKIQMIRVDCEKSELDFIKNNIINSEMNNIFDLSKVDWLKCHVNALLSNVKLVCDLWNNLKNVDKIHSETKLGKTTIRRYLKKGNKLNWCSYDAELERKINTINKSKKVEVFKNGTSLGIFNSVCELERLSEKIFNTKLLQGNISQVCRQEKDKYKGYFFKYV